MDVAAAALFFLVGWFLVAGFVVGGLVVEWHLRLIQDLRYAVSLHQVMMTLAKVGLTGGIIVLVGGALSVRGRAVGLEWWSWLVLELIFLGLFIVSIRVLRARRRLLEHIASGRVRRDAHERFAIINHRYRVLLAAQLVAIALDAWPAAIILLSLQP